MEFVHVLVGFDSYFELPSLPTQRGIFGDGIPDKDVTDGGDFEPRSHSSTH